MSSSVDRLKVSSAPSSSDAGTPPSPSKQLHRNSNESRSISIVVPPQPGSSLPSFSATEKLAPDALATIAATLSDASLLSPAAPLPRQNSSDDLDGYRSSCEGSVPEEGCRGSRENNSRSSSTVGPADGGGDAAQLSQQALAELSSNSANMHNNNSSSGIDGRVSGLLVTEACSPDAVTHSPPPPPPHRRYVASRQRATVGSAAREEERQRLMAMSSPNESAAAAAVASKNEAKSGRVTGAAAPGSLAAASEADSDCSSTDATCRVTQPVFASTNVKTAAALLSVTLESESRNGFTPTAAPAVAAESTAGSGKDKKNGVTTVSGGAGIGSSLAGHPSGEALMRVMPPLVSSQPNTPRTRAFSPVEAVKSPLQTTLSRLSRSSSNDSSAVEATMECDSNGGQGAATGPITASRAHRSTSLNPTARNANSASNSNSNVNSSSLHNSSSNVGGRSSTTSYGANMCNPVTALPLTEAPVKAAVIPAALTHPEQASAGDAAGGPPHEEVAAFSSQPKSRQPSHGTSPARTREQQVIAQKDVIHVADVVSYVNTTTNMVGIGLSPKISPPSSLHLLARTVDVSSSSSVGGHHLSVTEGNAFLKQSGSRREEAFYNMIQPYQEALVREAVRQAPHTVEHWRHQNMSMSPPSARRGEEANEGDAKGSAATAAAFTNTSITVPPRSVSPAIGDQPARIRHVHADASSIGDAVARNGATATATLHMDEASSLCEARWEAYQQYEAEDMSSLDILASAPPPITEEEKQQMAQLTRMRRDSVVADAPVVVGSLDHITKRDHDGTEAGFASAAFPLHQVDKNLVELAARLWWTIRFRHFYRTSSSAYEVQRQAAEAVGMSPVSLSASSLANGGGGGGGGRDLSRCSTPASQYRYPTSPALGTHLKEEPTNVDTPVQQPQMPAPLSGTATPNMIGSFAAPSSDGIVSNVSQSERQYSAQKHRALQLLAAFVPRYYGTRRLFVRDVLRCERRGMAATAAVAALVGSSTPVRQDARDPLTDTQREKAGEAAAATTMQHGEATTPGGAVLKPATPQIVDADNDDDDDAAEGNDAGGRKVCRMIMLEYVCYKFCRPCVMDVKMGSRQYGLHPTAEKKRSKEQKAKLSTSGRYGIRLAGYRRWNAEESRYEFRTKLQCRTLTLAEVKNEFSAFMLRSRELERVFQRQLQRLRVAFSQQTVFRFYTSSLLFVYDAEDPLATARVTMVDFAYTYESKELLQGGDPDADFAYDVGYLKAIDTLLSLLA